MHPTPVLAQSADFKAKQMCIQILLFFLPRGLGQHTYPLWAWVSTCTEGVNNPVSQKFESQGPNRRLGSG